MLFHSCEWIFFHFFFLMISIESLCTYTSITAYYIRLFIHNVSQSTRVYSISIFEWMENDGFVHVSFPFPSFHSRFCKKRKKHHSILIDKLSLEQEKMVMLSFQSVTFILIDFRLFRLRFL